ncbi:OmpA family protein [Photobacterium atrarenae]|uniref:OmpA family protein n=1 Tax=Photobacterium atrarenae TaxID=865757 RepID=A0ABY5GJ73_9GAMM|nr:OmpA family protein [Photobacterium atrarenae]UTV28632.1 OmpA family protein [Photobacterium atrarenae]
MKRWHCLFLSLLISGCAAPEGLFSTEAELPPAAVQQADLQDDDQDGVINARDKCEATALSAIVDNDGCPRHTSSTETHSLHVLFANNSAEIQPQYRPDIVLMADFLKQYPDTGLELQGHASKVGNHARNIELSRLRAEAVRQALINLGVTAGRLTIVGHGDNDPVRSANQEKAFSLSRRVVGTVTGFRGDIEKEWTIFTRRTE